MNIYEKPYESCASRYENEVVKEGKQHKTYKFNDIHQSRVNLPPVVDSKGRSDEILQLEWQRGEVDV